RAAFDIPRQENLKLRDFPTLGSVVQFVYTNRPDLKPTTGEQVVTAAPMPTTPITAPSVVSGPSSVVEPVVAVVLGIVAEKTGYPQEMLDLDLDLEADLGIDTV